jgi:hypothetical protein
VVVPINRSRCEGGVEVAQALDLLQRFCGKPPTDIEALAGAAAHFSPRPLTELEVNVVIVRPTGPGLAVVDCLMVSDSGQNALFAHHQ